MKQEVRNPVWADYTQIDWIGLTGVDVTPKQVNELRSRTELWGPEHEMFDPINDFYDYDPEFRVDHPYTTDKEQWEKLQRRCAAAAQSIASKGLRSSILAALEYKDIRPKGVKPGLLPPPPDLAYVINILRALANADRPTSDYQRRARNRGELAAVIGQWWYEVTGTEPTKDWQKFSEFLLALVNLEIQRPTFYKYWNKPEVRYSKGVLR